MPGIANGFSVETKVTKGAQGALAQHNSEKKGAEVYRACRSDAVNSFLKCVGSVDRRFPDASTSELSRRSFLEKTNELTIERDRCEEKAVLSIVKCMQASVGKESPTL